MGRARRRAVAVTLMVVLGLVGVGCAPSQPSGSDTPAAVPSATSPATGAASSAAASTRPSSAQPSSTAGTPSPSTPSATTPSPTPFDAYTAYVTVASLNLRAAASSDAEVSNRLTRGDKVRVIGSDLNGYTPVRHDGDDFWVSSGYLSTTRPAPLPTSVKAPVRTMYTTTELNVRSQPLAGTQVLGTLAKSAHVTTAGAVAGSWTSVSYQGQTGWVLSKYLTATKPTPASAPATTVALDKRCTTGLVICISKTDRVLRLVQDGKILISLDARFGSEAGPTREGTFKIEWRDKNWVSTLYGSKMPYAMFFSGGEAIHYSSDFAARGYQGNSHGCVNIRSMSGIEYLWNHAPVGTTVVVYR